MISFTATLNLKLCIKQISCHPNPNIKSRNCQCFSEADYGHDDDDEEEEEDDGDYEGHGFIKWQHMD